MQHATELANRNQILSKLPAEILERLSPDLELVELKSGKVLYNLGGAIPYIYFPLNALISLVLEMTDGMTIEVGVVGRDGAAGITALMGKDKATTRAIVQIPDGALRIKTVALKKEFARGEELHDQILHYASSLMQQVSQTAACNNHHQVEERLARWLLMCRDRIGSNEFNLTQEFISNMIGTHRPTVSRSASGLQAKGLIKYTRGQIEILDGRGLENRSCECYLAVKKNGR